MDSSKEKKYTPLLPYDAYFGENFTTYETMTYHCNRDACYPNIKKNTENIVKYYSYNMEEETSISNGE